jgi:hypothetical protein
MTWRTTKSLSHFFLSYISWRTDGPRDGQRMTKILDSFSSSNVNRQRATDDRRINFLISFYPKFHDGQTDERRKKWTHFHLPMWSVRPSVIKCRIERKEKGNSLFVGRPSSDHIGRWKWVHFFRRSSVCPSWNLG